MKTIQSFVKIVHAQSVAVENEYDFSKKQCLELTDVTFSGFEDNSNYVKKIFFALHIM
ncbi:Protein CBG26881 [Caenorhabditis briggsae]|uniref:Protein CBG26881 n=1 Tax=Caenorhabditis briggsae TaxID=6238 RepID=B6II81_CAEBR|nr:Protein CBG26881 [Caenorhabditis briggsae]CAR99611.1 Protein CBG26881 [Caenorhabditis briggsae]